MGAEPPITEHHMPKTAEDAQERAVGCLITAMAIGLILLGAAAYLGARFLLTPH